MVTTKRLLMVLVETIPDTPSLGKEIPMMIQLSFSIFLAQLDKMRDGKGGLLHVIAVCTKELHLQYTLCWWKWSYKTVSRSNISC